MRVIIILSSFIITISVAITAQTSIYDNIKVQTINVGGASIKTLPPDSSFIEVGTDNMELMEIFVPSTNKLFCAYVLKEDFPFLSNNSDKKIFSRYALVEVFRQAESFNLDANFFTKLKDELLESYNNDGSAMSKETEDEFYQRMKSINLTKQQLKIDDPVQLGCFFSKENEIGSGMRMKIQINGQIIEMGVLMILMRIKNRLLYVYLFAEYKNEETLLWLRQAGEIWGTEILKLNRP